MSEARIQPARPGAPIRESVRVRHRSTRREGRVAPDPATPAGDTRVLFDGDTQPVNVPARTLEYIDGASPPSSPKVTP